MTYLNHAGTSWPKPDVVWRAHDEMRATPPARWAAAIARAHAAVAASFGTTLDALALTPGCTQGLAVAVDVAGVRAGQRVVTSSLEHEALARPLDGLRRRGITVTEVGRGPEGPLDLDALRRTLEQGDVALVAVSMASNVTGEWLPWAQIVEAAHRHGARCLLDGAQVAGWVPLDLPAMGVDYFAFAGHKGPQAPTGVGGLYVRAGLERPTWCDTGSVARPVLAGLAAGLQWMAAADPLARALELEAQFRDEARRIPGVRVIGADGPRMPTCSVRIGHGEPADHARALGAHGVVVNGSLQCAPRAHRTLGTHPGGTVRLSFGPLSGDDDVAAALEALRATARLAVG